MLDLDDSARARFWSKVDKSGGPDACWPWTGRMSSTGYGRFTYKKRDYGAHRVASALAFGPIPPGLLACHSCDNPPCCNPRHLWYGTAADNAADMKAKGRSATGDKNGMRTHPHRTSHGEANGMHTRPERRAYGDRNGARTHPERVCRGEARSKSGMTKAKVRAIREEWARGGVLQREIAARHGVRQQTVSKIITRETWAHVL